MKVRVTQEFKDKYSGELHKIGTEMNLSVKRINEILKVGGFLEIVETEDETEQIEQTEPIEPTEQADVTEKEPENTETEEPKATGRRKRSK